MDAVRERTGKEFFRGIFGHFHRFGIGELDDPGLGDDDRLVGIVDEETVLRFAFPDGFFSQDAVRDVDGRSQYGGTPFVFQIGGG